MSKQEAENANENDLLFAEHSGVWALKHLILPEPATVVTNLKLLVKMCIRHSHRKFPLVSCATRKNGTLHDPK